MAELSILTITYNCGRSPVDVEQFATYLAELCKQNNAWPDIVFLSLQEVAPIAYAFLGGSFLQHYLLRFIQAVKSAAPGEHYYDHLISRNVGMTANIILGRPSILSRVASREVAGVGVGLWEMGNKGAAAVRIQFEDLRLPLTFVAAHLAPMESAWQRRNKDWKEINRGLAFRRADARPSRKMKTPHTAEAEPLLPSPEAVENTAALFEPASAVFFAGDLNYRVSDQPPTSDEHEAYPQPGDDLDQWRSTDQLTRERKAGRTLHGLSEADITFPPTYKYRSEDQPAWPADGSEPSQWAWSSHRFPSWCDRILFSAGKGDSSLEILAYTAMPLMRQSDHRPVALFVRVDTASLMSASDQSSNKQPFTLDRRWASRRASARRLELIVGVLSYLGLTWEGRSILTATVFGLVGGWFVFRAALLDA